MSTAFVVSRGHVFNYLNMLFSIFDFLNY
ncbi:unnamed protein product [Spirodela intermedia]|uniref:Uncharacterized protein n=1 Tax=Spirodela intermedia TaxID=51605 RepID=A0A7I8JX95_SPIIN|nr:unnamed protein product [Spirodela intermedia]